MGFHNGRASMSAAASASRRSSARKPATPGSTSTDVSQTLSLVMSPAPPEGSPKTLTPGTSANISR